MNMDVSLLLQEPYMTTHYTEHVRSQRAHDIAQECVDRATAKFQAIEWIIAAFNGMGWHVPERPFSLYDSAPPLP